MAGVALAAIASGASASRVDRNHIRSMLMGVLGLAALFQLVVLEATDTPAEAHFWSLCSAVVVLSAKEIIRSRKKER